jgi:MinD-like ATPase involved in chromosome partitioning or flagellar assembly
LDLPTYTSIWRIEKRLYKLYDFRLPAPLPITWIGVFVAITVPYVAFLLAVGLSFNHTLVWLYVLPPAVLTWLTTRPVMEGKRLPELVTSQVRYIAEPRAWCRMTPFAEKDAIVVSAQVWHGHPARVRATKALTRVQPAAAIPESASTDVAEAGLPPAADQVALPAGYVREQARASAWPAATPAATPAAAAPRSSLVWSPWPRGSAPETEAPEPDCDDAPASRGRPAWMIAAPPATVTSDSRTLGASCAAGPLSDLAGPPAALSPPTLQREPIIVTLGQLQGIRAWWRKLAPAAAALRQLGFTGQGEQVADVAYALGAARFAVAIPCITCRTPTPVDVGIGDPGNPEPGDALCGTCSTETDELAPAHPTGHGEASRRHQAKRLPGRRMPGLRDQDRTRLHLAGPRRIAVLGCTRGAGQTVTVLMTGHVLASLRDTAVAAVDLDPGATSLATRRAPAVSIRAVLAGRQPDGPAGRSGATLEVIADLPGAHGSGLGADDYQRLASRVAMRYPLTMIDPAPGSLEQVLATADQLLLVARARPDAATSLASTLRWLDAHGYGELAQRAVTVVNGVSRRTMEDVLRAESVARGRCGAIVRVPWDDLLSARPGPPPVSHPHRALNPPTGAAYTTLAGELVAALAANSASIASGRNAGGRTD